MSDERVGLDALDRLPNVGLTTEIILIHHSDCGMLTFADADVKAAIEADTGIRPPFALEAFSDLGALRASNSSDAVIGRVC